MKRCENLDGQCGKSWCNCEDVRVRVSGSNMDLFLSGMLTGAKFMLWVYAIVGIVFVVCCLSGCGTCRVIERYNESYARGRFVRCPEGVWVYNHDLISDERQRYLITNEELSGGQWLSTSKPTNRKVNHETKE